MNQSHLIRGAAAALVLVVTFSGLKVIAALAHADAELPVINLPRVEVTAPKSEGAVVVRTVPLSSRI